MSTKTLDHTQAMVRLCDEAADAGLPAPWGNGANEFGAWVYLKPDELDAWATWLNATPELIATTSTYRHVEVIRDGHRVDVIA